MKDIKLLETCKCGENLTLMESINVDTNKLMLVKRCLKCGCYPVEEVVEIQKNDGVEKTLWTNGTAFRRYQGQDKSYPKTNWKKVKAIVYDIE